MNSSMMGYQGIRGPTGSASGQNYTGANFVEKIPKGYKTGALQQFTPEQLQLFQQMFGHLGPDSYLSRLAGGDESFFDEMEAPALRQFQGLQGNMASRFSGFGGEKSLGARRSSGFQNEMSAASSNLAQDLQSRRQGLQRQAIRDLMGLSENLLGQRPYERFMIEKQQKPNRNWGSLIGAGIGGAVGLAGGPFGAAFGSQVGHQIGQAFV